MMMPGNFVFHHRGTFVKALYGICDQTTVGCPFVLLASSNATCRIHSHVISIHHIDHMPAKAAKPVHEDPHGPITSSVLPEICSRFLSTIAHRDYPAYTDPPAMAAFPDRTFRQLTVSHHGIYPALPCHPFLLAKCHSHTDRKSMSERTGIHLNPRQLDCSDVR